MADAARKNDLTSDPPGPPGPRAFAQFSTNVEINGQGAVRHGDNTLLPVSNVPLSNASQSVEINGKKAVRKGDILLDTSFVAQGSTNVDIGN